MTLVASICGAESCVDIADFACDRETLFGKFLELPGDIPSHDPFSRLFRLFSFVGELAAGRFGVAGYLDIDARMQSFQVRPAY